MAIHGLSWISMDAPQGRERWGGRLVEQITFSNDRRKVSGQLGRAPGSFKEHVKQVVCFNVFLKSV